MKSSNGSIGRPSNLSTLLRTPEEGADVADVMLLRVADEAVVLLELHAVL